MTRLRLITILLTVLLSVPSAWGATKTVCSSGCDYTTATEALETNEQSAGTIIEFRADAPGGSKTWTEDSILIHASTHGTGDADGNRVIIRGRTGDTITLAANSGQTCAVRAQFGAQNYVTFQNLTFSGGTTAAFDARVNTGIKWIDCTFTGGVGTGSGMYFNGAQTAFSMLRCHANSNGGKGMAITAASTGTITDSTFNSNGNYGLSGILGGITYTGCEFAYNFSHGFVNDGVSSGTTVITTSTAHDNCETYPSCTTYHHGFCLANGMSNVTMYRNYSYNVDKGIDIQATSASNSAIVAYSNIFTGTNGVTLAAANASCSNSDIIFYSNDIIATRDGGTSLFLGQYNGSGIVFRNNIISHQYDSLLIDLAAGGPYPTMDNNLYYSDNSTAFYDKTGMVSFADWKTASSQDANSVWGNPLLDSDLRPAANSPALWQRATLGSPYDTDYDGLWFGDRGAPIGALTQGNPRSHNTAGIK